MFLLPTIDWHTQRTVIATEMGQYAWPVHIRRQNRSEQFGVKKLKWVNWCSWSRPIRGLCKTENGRKGRQENDTVDSYERVVVFSMIAVSK